MNGWEAPDEERIYDMDKIEPIIGAAWAIAQSIQMSMNFKRRLIY